MIFKIAWRLDPEKLLSHDAAMKKVDALVARNAKAWLAKGREWTMEEWEGVLELTSI